MLKLKLQYFGHLMRRVDSMEKTLVLGKIEGGRRREEQRMRWHHQLSGHEVEQVLGDGDGQGSLACCSPWGRKESDTTKHLNNNHHHHDQPSSPRSGTTKELEEVEDVLRSKPPPPGSLLTMPQHHP